MPVAVHLSPKTCRGEKPPKPPTRLMANEGLNNIAFAEDEDGPSPHGVQEHARSNSGSEPYNRLSTGNPPFCHS